MRTTVDELIEHIELIKVARTRETVINEAEYTLGFIRALEITYMLNRKSCETYRQKAAEARDERLKEIER